MLAKNPAMFQWAKNAPVDEEKTDALESGTAFHCAVLEPQEFASRYAAAPVFNLRTNDGKAQRAEWLESLPAGVKILDADLHRKLMLMRDSVYAHPTARSVLEACEDRELSGFYVDSVTGERCKFRPDAASRERHIIADLKQTADFDRMDLVFEQLLYQAIEYGYEYHKSTKFPELGVEDNMRGNAIQWIYNATKYSDCLLFTQEDMLDFATDQKNRGLEPTEETLMDWINYR